MEQRGHIGEYLQHLRRRQRADPERRRYIEGHFYQGREIDGNILHNAINNRSFRHPITNRMMSFVDYVWQTDQEMTRQYDEELRICTASWPQLVLREPHPVRTVAFEIHQKLTLHQDAWITLDFGQSLIYVTWWLLEGSQFFIDFRLRNPFFGPVVERRARYAEEYRSAWRHVNHFIRRLQEEADPRDWHMEILIHQIDQDWDNAFVGFQRVTAREFWQEQFEREGQVDVDDSDEAADVADVELDEDNPADDGNNSSESPDDSDGNDQVDEQLNVDFEE